MSRAEINNSLYQIREKSDKDNAEKFLLSMEDIFKIKPVTMLFFNVKAKLLCDMGKYDDAVGLLTVTINFIILEEESIETCKIFQRAYKALDNDTLFKQWSCMEDYIRFTLNQDENSLNNVKALEDRNTELEQNFINSLNNDQTEMKLANAYYESWYSVEGTVMYALSIKKSKMDYKDSLFFKDRIRFETNHTFLLEELLNKNGVYILLTNNYDYQRTMAIAKTLTMLGQQVYVVMPAISVKVEYNIDLNETVEISMDNIEIDNDGITKITPLDIVLDDKIIGNNAHLVLEELSKTTSNDFAIVLGSSQIFTSLNDTPDIKKRMQRLSEFRGDLLEGSFVFGYFGSYTSYMSIIYSMDVDEEINKQSEYEFSIVIPVRNSAESLRYTLQTCLEQRGMDDNSYEIVVSDNSYPEYMEVEMLVKEINDSRIKYYRTPRYLNLNRSFEYAFLKAKGDFIFSIGADDAVLPWGIEVLKKVLKELPNDDVLQWDRGFFIWSDSVGISSTQAGQFIIPKSYNKTNINVTKNNAKEQLMHVLNNPDLMYGMPMLYINSGCRRRYLNKMLKNTGRLWDGASQDVYMGIVNLAINETIPYLQYPITIAGMSNNSIGFEEKNVDINIKSNINKIIDNSNCGVSVVYGKGLNFIPVSLDISLVYFAFYRYINAVPSDEIELLSNVMNWKEIFRNVAIKYNCEGLRYDYYVKSLRYSAYYHGEEIGKWFDDNLLELIMSPKTIKHSDKKNYLEGFFPGGGLQLDARKFGAMKVNEAVKLFENICNL